MSIQVVISMILTLVMFVTPPITYDANNNVTALQIGNDKYTYTTPMNSVLVLPDNNIHSFNNDIHTLAKSITNKSKTQYDQIKAIQL